MPSPRIAATLAAGVLCLGLPLAGPAFGAPDAASSDGFRTDSRGFVDSTARCPEGQSAVALGRTQRSLVVVCTTPDGGPLEYRGVRISDGAALKAAVTTAGTAYTAETGDATYTVTPETLSVVSGGKVIYRDTWIDYQSPGAGAGAGSAAGAGAAGASGAGTAASGAGAAAG